LQRAQLHHAQEPS